VNLFLRLKRSFLLISCRILKSRNLNIVFRGVRLSWLFFSNLCVLQFIASWCYSNRNCRYARISERVAISASQTRHRDWTAYIGGLLLDPCFVWSCRWHFYLPPKVGMYFWFWNFFVIFFRAMPAHIRYSIASTRLLRHKHKTAKLKFRLLGLLSKWKPHKIPSHFLR